MSGDSLGLKRVLTFEELERVLAPLGAPTEVSYFDGGLFASVARVGLADGRTVAVKSGPARESTTLLLAHERNVMRAEVEVLAIGSENPALRLPTLLLVDTSRQAVPVDVMVMTLIAGERWDTCWQQLTPAATERARYDVGRILAAFNSLVGHRFGFVSDRAPRYTSRDWFTTFRLMCADMINDAAAHGLDVRGADVLASVDRHCDYLREVTQPRLAHGDLWAGNTMVDPATGAVLGVIDPERALWGDPIFDLAGADQITLDELPPALLQGLADGGRRLDLNESTRTRLNLYRLWFAVAMLAEEAVRGHLFVDREARRAGLRAQLDALLALLDG